MLIELPHLREILRRSIICAGNQGKAVDGMEDELKAAPDSYDALDAFSRKLAGLPLRKGWPYIEPDDIEGIKSQWAKGAACAAVPVKNARERAGAAFLARVCGCMLGKPVEFNPPLAGLKAAGEACNEWPIRDYISDKFLDTLGKHNECRVVTSREKIACAVPDDDIDYTIMGMLLLERHGLGFTRGNQKDLWLANIAPGNAYGPERNIMAKAVLSGLDLYGFEKREPDYQDWRARMNPGAELCGALIRIDAYGYACQGNPAMAAGLAYKDASFTHVKTGVYSAMYIAAALALAAVEKDLMTVMRRALDYVPQKSRFAEITKDCLGKVEQAPDWMTAYLEINRAYGMYTHCAIYQETGTLINSLRFAANTGEAFCLQVMQGNDTDSFGATAGSIAGMFYGMQGLDSKWLKPLNNTIKTGLAGFHEQDLSKVAGRMGKLADILR